MTSSIRVLVLLFLFCGLSPAHGEEPIVEGYADRLSVVPGEEVGLHLSANTGKVSITITRIGAKNEQVFQRLEVPVESHPVPARASSDGCGWPAAMSVKIPGNWKSGYYEAKLVGQIDSPSGETSEATGTLFFVVRSAQPGKNSKILLQLSTNTYNAYTNWGGHSLYSYHDRDGIQGHRVSFDRPQKSQFGNWEAPFVQWAESNGYALDYAVNSDLEFHPEILQHYKLVLSIGHDEYWSSPMRDHLEKFISDGGNVAFLSGNTCCWQVRSEDAGVR